jgi:hypothetical protein
MFDSTPLGLQRSSRTMTTPCWLVLIIMSFYAIPKGLLFLAIPLNRILRNVKDAVAYLTLLVSRKISALASAKNLSRCSHGQRNLCCNEWFSGLCTQPQSTGRENDKDEPTTLPSQVAAALEPLKNHFSGTHRQTAVGGRL